MQFTNLDELKDELKKQGFDQKAVLDDADMANAASIFDQNPDVIDTPDNELRYIEGLFSLPLGYLTEFKIIPKPGYQKCQCGRTPTALDVVHYAYAKHVHSKDLIRDTLIGFSNLFEMSTTGRTTECYSCGRKIEVLSYRRTRRYIYA